MNEHWSAVFCDIWSFMRWFVPPGLFMFLGTGALGKENHQHWDPTPEIFVFCLAAFAYAAALLGWWT
jgi:hypothetical protein